MNKITHQDLYRAYPDRDLLSIEPPTKKTSFDEFVQAAEHAGDTLFLFLLREICSPADPCNTVEAELRLASAIADIKEVRENLSDLR